MGMNESGESTVAGSQTVSNSPLHHLEGGRRVKFASNSELAATQRSLTDHASSRSDIPKITVIIAVFNGAESLEATIQSVLTQACDNFELVVVDGGSSDGTIDILKRYDNNIEYWMSKPDSGIYDAFNKAARLAAGEWIVFIGAGDRLYDPGVLAKIAETAANVDQSTEIIYGRVSIVNEENVAVKTINWPWEQMSGKWRGGRPMLPHHQGIFHRRTLLSSEKPFDTKYTIAADSKLIYRSLASVPPAFVDIIVAEATLGGKSTEPAYFLRTANEIIAINYELKHRNYLHQFWFYLKSLAKHILHLLAGKNFSIACIDKYRVITGRSPKWTK
jgi:glycosyltransferase involved in cell wall biosynthesis